MAAETAASATAPPPPGVDATLLAKCEALAKLAKEVQVLLSADKTGTDLNPVLYNMLAGPLCKLTKTVEPYLGKKVDEIIYVYEHPQSATGVEHHVNPIQHGADILDKDGKSMELKTAVCKAKEQANFNWALPSAKGITEEQRRSKLLKSVQEKTHGNGCKLVIKNGKQVTLAEYTLSSAFMLGYFARVPYKPTSTVHNFGCSPCKTCGDQFHRVQRMQLYSDYMVTKDTKVLSDDQWEDILTDIKSDCKGVPYKIKK